MRLLLVELNRFRSRRAIALMLLAIILLMGWMTLDTVWQSRPSSATEIAAAKQAAAEENQAIASELADCKADPARYTGVSSATPEDCPEGYRSDYRQWLDRRPLDLPAELRDTGRAGIVLLTGIAVIVGATFAGADWATGSISNQLLFRPRRTPMWLAKAIAVVSGVTAVAAALIATQWASYLFMVDRRHEEVPSGFVPDLLEYTGRGLALIAAAALGGYALTMLLRSTVGTLAVLFFTAAGGTALLTVLPLEKATQWSLTSNIRAWLEGGAQVYDDSIACPPGGGSCTMQYTLSMGQAGTYLGVLLVLAVVASLLLFRRRDIP